METKSYEHLEGKIIDWRSPQYKGGKIFKVKVAGIDPDIGITLVNAEDPEDFVTCVNGPLSPQGRRLPPELYEGWEDEFNRRVAAIKAGLFDVGAIYKTENRFLDPFGGNPDADDCSFL